MVLCLGGAFNPVHTQHIALMVVAKRWIYQNTDYDVIAGGLAVAPDGYVKGKTKKLNQNCMKDTHRIRLCELACEEADQHSWLRTYPKPFGSALECGKRIIADSKHLSSYVKVAVILGADRAVNKRGRAKWQLSKEPEYVTVCIGRKGETGAVIERWRKDKKDNNIKYPESFILIPEEVEPISSTDVRKYLSEIHSCNSSEQKESILNSAVLNGLLHKGVAEYVLQHESDLYL